MQPQVLTDQYFVPPPMYQLVTMGSGASASAEAIWADAPHSLQTLNLIDIGAFAFFRPQAKGCDFLQTAPRHRFYIALSHPPTGRYPR